MIQELDRSVLLLFIQRESHQFPEIVVLEATHLRIPLPHFDLRSCAFQSALHNYIYFILSLRILHTETAIKGVA